jgi:hypothetical protein
MALLVLKKKKKKKRALWVNRASPFLAPPAHTNKNIPFA